MLPSARLLELAGQGFSHHWLGEIARTLERLPALAPESRVAAFVLRRVCSEMAGWMDAVAPIEADRHAAIEAAVAPRLRAALERLARFQSLEWADLAALIAAAEHARRNL
jgi:hypothetical protein